MVMWDEEPQGTLQGNDRRRTAKKSFDSAAKRIAERERFLKTTKRTVDGPVDDIEEETTRG